MLMENDRQMGFADAGLLPPQVYNTAVPRATTNERGSGGIVLSKKKRPRETLSPSSSFLGEHVSSQTYSHMLDVDRLVVQHVIP